MQVVGGGKKLVADL